jgi:hypothetical protein
VWSGYSIPKALQGCDLMAARIGLFPLFNCWDGVFMENVWKVHGNEHADVPHDSEVVQVHGRDYAHVA